MALWALLWFAKEKSIRLSHIYGDSQCVIDWACGHTELRPLLLVHWRTRVRALILHFNHISFSHMFRCFNGEADRLSKSSLGRMDGHIHFAEFNDGVQVDANCLDY